MNIRLKDKDGGFSREAGMKVRRAFSFQETGMKRSRISMADDHSWAVRGNTGCLERRSEIVDFRER